MAGMFGDKINSRSDFFARLALAQQELARILTRLPHESTLKSVAMQLAAIRSWTANGETPTFGDRKSIDMGLRMFREYEMTDDAEIRALRAVVSSVDTYIKFWPDDATAADPNNDRYLAFSRL